MTPSPPPRAAAPATRRCALRALAAGAAGAVAPALRAQSAAGPPRLQIVGPWEIAGLAPAVSGYVFTRLQIAETLVDADDDGTLLPGLAERFEASADGLAWRFVLRQGARFHDGIPVRAAAVVRCLEAARRPPSLLSGAPIQAIEAEDDSTVRVRLSRPHAALPALLAHSSTLVLAPASYAPDGAVRSIVGSGPYRITALAAPQRVEAEAFDGHGGPRPAIERVAYLSAGRSETRALMAEAGQADLAYGLDPASTVRLRRHATAPGPVRVESVTLPRSVGIKVNAGLPALRDPRVRRALSLCIDRAGIARALLRDPALAATQLFPPTLRDWHADGLEPLALDPEAAARLLAEAGWRRGADGLRDAQGQPLRLALRTFPDRPELPLIATALQAQWREAGIAVRVDVGNSGDIPLGHRDGSLQLALIARNYATTPDPTSTLAQDFGPRGGDWGAMGWSDARVADALATLQAGGIPKDRAAALRRQVVRTLQDELPVIPVAWYRQTVAISRRVGSVRLDPLERSYRLTAMEWRA
ncbi:MULTISPECIES: ABC transporter substrate-binding protein [Comamonadaceae]|uniref:ABC transporter substrate-binding protein n=1 Tax=Acidovorax sacchari TaxID=3230736 RepID=UPI0034A3389E